MAKKKEYIGNKYGKLTVIEDLGYFIKEGTKRKEHYLKCKCDCGNEKIIRAGSLSSGHTKSCGCLTKKSNKYYIFNNIVFVKFSNCDEFFICDLDDWIILKRNCWYKSNDGYACSRTSGNMELFHRLVMNCNEDKLVDHIFQVSNGICDNRKNNLRIVTQQQNSMNAKLSKNNTSGYKGVYWKKHCNKWSAAITYNGKQIHLGYFDDIEKAIKARADAELKYFGEYRNKW